MDLSFPNSTTNSPLTPVFGDNVQDLLNSSALNVNPSAIITVNSIDDTVNDPNSGVTTLRDAINQANSDAGEDLIVFDRSVFSTAQTITLSGTELDITHNLDIIAPRDPLTGGDLVTVSGNNATRVFEIGTGATVSIDGLIVADGQVTGDNGGGIKNSGTLTLDSSIVRNNSATGMRTSINRFSTIGGNGGGIYNIGTSTVNNSTISGNSASGDGSFLSIAISGNGGGIYNSSGNSTVNNSTISGNSASGSGGGIYNSASVVMLVSGISNRITSTVNNSTISGNSASGSGGGISNSDTSEVNNSTISGNSASLNGGGISNGGTMNVSNSTISGNSASLNGGGISNGFSSTLKLLFSTITQNQAANGGGVYQQDVRLVFISGGGFEESDVLLPFEVRGSKNVRNTIIAANLNSTGSVNPDVSGTFTSNGYNLIGDSTGSNGFGSPGDIVGTSDRPIDPRLAPLDFYGGPTQNFALLPDSPAIDAGDPTILDTDPTTDQRGLPRVSNGRADIGAYEVQV